MKRRHVMPGLAAALAIALAFAGPLSAETQDQRLEKLGDEFIDGWLTRAARSTSGTNRRRRVASCTRSQGDVKSRSSTASTEPATRSR